MNVLTSPAPTPCSSGSKFSVLAFREELPQAFSSGFQVKGEGSPFLAAKGEGVPQAILDLLAAFMAAHSKLLIWVCGLE